MDFCKKGKNERKIAKENIKYFENRPGKEGVRRPRTLFGAHGHMTRQQGYDMVNDAPYGSTFFRVKISPDPEKEDTHDDLFMREIVKATLDIEERIGTPLAWIAAIHDDHTNIRHMHVLAVTKARRLPAGEMIDAATRACSEQRQELDVARQQSLTKEQGIGRELTWQREP